MLRAPHFYPTGSRAGAAICRSKNLVNTDYQVPDLSKQRFARTNLQTVIQRANLLRELLPNVASIAELCSGNCSRQWRLYTQQLGIRQFRCLDTESDIVAMNRRLGIECVCGDALDESILQLFLNFEVLFFGPPLSVGCDGHQSLMFREVTPSYSDFKVLLGELQYSGTLICICPKTTTMGDIAQLYHQIQDCRRDFGFRLIHRTHSTLTGDGEETELRLKYVELWFSDCLEDKWEVRESKSA